MMALAYPELDATAREILAVDYFMDSLGDPDLIHKVRERMPSTLDEALKVAMRLEVWAKDSVRLREDKGKHLSARSAGPGDWAAMERIADNVDAMSAKMQELLKAQSSKPVETASGAQPPVARQPQVSVQTQGQYSHRPERKQITCWSCGKVGHRKVDCRSRQRYQPVENEPRTSMLRVRATLRTEENSDVLTALAGENSVSNAQQADEEIGMIVRLKLAGSTPPSQRELATKSKWTKLLARQWNRLVVRQGVVYRHFSGRGCRPRLQLLVPTSLRADVIEMCHLKADGSHRGLRRTMDEIQNLFFWWTWRGDTARFFQRCSDCKSSRHARVPESVPLQPVVAQAREEMPMETNESEPESEELEVNSSAESNSCEVAVDHPESPEQLTADLASTDSDSGYSGFGPRIASAKLISGGKCFKRWRRQHSGHPESKTDDQQRENQRYDEQPKKSECFPVRKGPLILPRFEIRL
jgi:hypothetical protein